MQCPLQGSTVLLEVADVQLAFSSSYGQGATGGTTEYELTGNISAGVRLGPVAHQAQDAGAQGNAQCAWQL